jgi:glucose-1-phosphatase
MKAQESSLTPPTGVIFDIGRVIIRLNLMRALAPLAASRLGKNTALSPEQIWAAIQADPLWHDWQEGRLTPQQWHEHLMRSLTLSLSFEEFKGAWNSALEPQTILRDHLFACLSRRCRLGLLSNTDPLHVEHIERNFSFWRYFPARIYSCDTGSSKPSPAIYHAALTTIGLRAAEALYIDDVEEFAESARLLGMDAIHFENPLQLDRELSRRGLLAS